MPESTALAAPSLQTVKALSIKQPWANLIACGEKSIEVRSWTTNYRGPLLIVSSRSPNIEPAGFALALCYLSDCRPMRKRDEQAALCEYYPGDIAWVLTNVCRVEPFPVQGKLNLYNVEFDPSRLLNG